MPPRFLPKELDQYKLPEAGLGGFVHFLKDVGGGVTDAGKWAAGEEYKNLQALGGAVKEALGMGGNAEWLTPTEPRVNLPGNKYLRQAEETQQQFDLTSALSLIQNFAREYGGRTKARYTTEPSGVKGWAERILSEPINALASVPQAGLRALQDTTIQDFKRYELENPGSGAYEHQPLGWVKKGPSPYDPLNSADFPMRQAREDVRRKSLTTLLGRDPTDDELVLAIARGGDIPLPPYGGKVGFGQQTEGPTVGPAGTTASDINLRWFLSQPNNPSDPVPGKGDFQIQTELSRAIHDPNMAMGDPLKNVMNLISPLEGTTRAIGSNILEPPAKLLETAGEAFGMGGLTATAGALRQGRAQEIAGGVATLALPGVGMGPKGFTSLLTGIVKSPSKVWQVMAREAPVAVEAGANIHPVEVTAEELTSSIKRLSEEAAGINTRLPTGDYVAATGGYQKHELQQIRTGGIEGLLKDTKVDVPMHQPNPNRPPIPKQVEVIEGGNKGTVFDTIGKGVKNDEYRVIIPGAPRSQAFSISADKVAPYIPEELRTAPAKVSPYGLTMPSRLSGIIPEDQLLSRVAINSPEEAQALLDRGASAEAVHSAIQNARIQGIKAEIATRQSLLDVITPLAKDEVEKDPKLAFLRQILGKGGLTSGPEWRGKLQNAVDAWGEVVRSVDDMFKYPQGKVELTNAKVTGKDVLSSMTVRFRAAAPPFGKQTQSPELLAGLLGETASLPGTRISVTIPGISDAEGKIGPARQVMVNLISESANPITAPGRGALLGAEGKPITGGAEEVPSLTIQPGSKGKVFDPDKIIVAVKPTTPMFDPTTGKAISPDEVMQVPMSQLTFQFNAKGLSEYRRLMNDASQYIGRITPSLGKQASGMQEIMSQTLGDMAEPEITKGVVATQADFQTAVRKTLDDFRNTDVTGWVSLDETPSTTALRIQRTKGYQQALKVQKDRMAVDSMSPAKQDAWYEAKRLIFQGMRKTLAERGQAVHDDVEMAAALSHIDKYDPAYGLVALHGMMDDPELLAKVADGSAIDDMGLIGDAARMLKGRAFSSDKIQGLIMNYTSADAMMATEVKGTWAPLVQDIKAAAADVVNSNLKPWAQRWMSQPGRAAQFWRGRVASDQEALETLLESKLKIPKISPMEVGESEAVSGTKHVSDYLSLLRRGIKKGEISQERLDNFQHFIGTNLAYYIHYPEWFKDMPAKVVKLTNLMKGLNDGLRDQVVYEGASDVSAATLNRFSVAPALRNQLEGEIIKGQGLIEMTIAADKYAAENGKTLASVMSNGDMLTMSEPMAYKKAIQNKLTKDVIMSMGKGVVKDDVLNIGGRWEIKSLNKWPKELRTDLEIFGDVMQSGNPKGLEGLLNRAAQGVTTGILTADANIVSLQLFPAISMSFLHDVFGPLVTAAKIIGKEAAVEGAATTTKPIWEKSQVMQLLSNVWNVTSDAGYHAWARNNLDELMFNASKGIRTGMESMVAGAMPLEPWWAKGPLKQLNAFNDLQFNRWLLVMKTMAVRQHAEMAQILRAIPINTAMKFVRGVPGITDVVKESGGEANYIYGLPEDVYGAICRVVNNQFGGLSMRAQGMTGGRIAAENTLMIVPSFFRAQAGMVSTALTRWNTVEGWLTITGMAQEAAFAAMLAQGISMATGNAHKVNFTDPSRSDWLAVQDGTGYIPILPRTSLIHLLGRAVKAIGAGSPGQVLTSEKNALSTFALGRLNPIVNLALQQKAGRDFLGRKYTDNWDRAINGISAFIPIFMQQTIQDMRENAKERGWGDLTWEQAVKETGMSWLGRNEVPRAPVDKLNDISHAWADSHDRDWFDLTTTEQQHLREVDPMAATAWSEYQFYQSRRNTSVEDQQDALFKDLENYRVQIRTDPTSVGFKNQDGSTTTQWQDFQLLQAGAIDGTQYIDRLKWRQGRIAGHNDDIVKQLMASGTDLDKARQRNLDKYNKEKDQLSFYGLVDLAKFEYQQVQPEQYQITRVEGGTTYQDTNWDAFMVARQKAMDQYPLAVQAAAKTAMKKDEDPGMTRYYAASDVNRRISDMPRYNNLTKAQGDKLDMIGQQANLFVDQMKEGMHLQPGQSMPAGAAKALRSGAIQDLQQRGLIRTNEDMKLATLALMMISDPRLKDTMTNPKVAQMILANPDTALFYPYLVSWVPANMRNKLPKSVLDAAGESYNPEQAFQQYYQENPGGP